MRLLYTVLIHISGWFIRAAALFDTKLSRWVAGRRHFPVFPEHDQAAPVCWIHCASAGEFEQAIPIIDTLRQREPKWRFYVSFFSPSGMEQYEKSGLADFFFLLPLDTPKKMNRLIQSIQPAAAIFIRREIWYNLLLTLRNKHIPAFLVNAPSSENDGLIYRIYLQKTMPLFTRIFDTATYGNTKTDRVLSLPKTPFHDEILSDFCRDSNVLILGSSWETEEAHTAAFFRQYTAQFPHLKIIIAPHEYDDTKAVQLEKMFSEKDGITSSVTTYTSYRKSSNKRVLMLDKKGLLKYAYRYGQLAIIGGGFGKGVHNIAEASVYGLPCWFGPHHAKFEECGSLIAEGLAFSYDDYTQLESQLKNMLSDSNRLHKIREKLQQHYAEQSRCADKISDEIRKAL